MILRSGTTYSYNQSNYNQSRRNIVEIICFYINTLSFATNKFNKAKIINKVLTLIVKNIGLLECSQYEQFYKLKKILTFKIIDFFIFEQTIFNATVCNNLHYQLNEICDIYIDQDNSHLFKSIMLYYKNNPIESPSNMGSKILNINEHMIHFKNKLRKRITFKSNTLFNMCVQHIIHNYDIKTIKKTWLPKHIHKDIVNLSESLAEKKKFFNIKYLT